MNSEDTDTVLHRLVAMLREEFLPLLTDGTWTDIKDSHQKVGLPWRTEFEPGCGKPKYVSRILTDLADEEVILVARRALDRLPGRNRPWSCRPGGETRPSPI